MTHWVMLRFLYCHILAVTSGSSSCIDYGESPVELSSQPTFGATADTASTPVGVVPQGGLLRPATRDEDILMLMVMQIDEPKSSTVTPAA